MAVHSQELVTVSAPALSVEGLGKKFGDKVAFADVSFEAGRRLDRPRPSHVHP